MRKLLLASLLLVPTAASAYECVFLDPDYTSISEYFTDAASFTPSEKAAINRLVDRCAVSGYPDKTFRPHRTLNRAEFLKIVYLNESIDDLGLESDSCFPDVRKEDWFSPYVCAAKEVGAVQGYPDGLFHPERNVNYAEALKMEGKLYGYHIDAVKYEDDEWYELYAREAKHRGVALSEAPAFNAFITRGQMARLAAAFHAESLGDLDAYHAEERGEEITSSSSNSSTSSTSSDSSSSSVSSVSSISSVSSSASVATLPAKNDIILIDRKTPAFADGTFLQPDQEVLVREVRVTLKKKITSFSELYLIDADGKEWGTLRLDLTDSTDEKWYVNLDAAAAPHMQKNTPTTFGLTGKLRAWGYGGVSGEMIEVERFSLIVQSLDASSSWEILPTASNFRKVQTAQTMLTKIGNAGEVGGTLAEGMNKVVGQFSFSGSIVPGAGILNVEQLTFTVNAVGATIASPKIGLPGGAITPCSLVGTIVTCNAIPASAQDASKGLTLELRADVTYTGQGVHTVQMLINDPGTVDQPGAIQWFDGSTHFTWVPMSAPVARGTNWTVVKP